MKTRCAVLHEARSPFAVAVTDGAPPAAGEVLVEVLCCTICGSDLHTFSGRRPLDGSTILGHEIVGRVVRLGAGVAPDLQIGQRVTWSLCASCGACFYCSRGLPQKCQRLFKYGHEPQAKGRPDGGLASHCLLRAGTTILRVPDTLSDEVACPANCATATVMAALRRAGDCRGAVVVILGAGMLGLTATAAVRTAGAERVVLADIDPRRLELAKKFGADESVSVADGFTDLQAVVRQATQGQGADCVLEMSGARAAVQASLQLARIGGSVVWVGAVFPDDPIPLEAEQVVRRLLRIEGVHNYAPQDLAAALEFLEGVHGRYEFEKLVERSFPLDAVDEAFRYATDHHPVRLAIRP